MEEKTIITSSNTKASEAATTRVIQATTSERIIPITILSSRHGQNDENDNNATVASIDMASKRLSMPISSNNNTAEAAGELVPAETASNGSSGTKRHSLLVTLDDGTMTQTQGTVTRLQPSPTPPPPLGSNGLAIKEIGQDTFKRLAPGVVQTSTPVTSVVATPLVDDSHALNVTAPAAAVTKESPATAAPNLIQAAPTPSVRVVPIKLVDGKVIHRQPDESMQMKSEFTNFSHQEFPGNESSKSTSEPEMVIPRLDNKEGVNKENITKEPLDERIVPIKLIETGETLMPTFTQLEDPKLPEWSTFSSLNKAPEREVPLKTEQPKPEQQQQQRGRERSRNAPTAAPVTPPPAPPSPKTSSTTAGRSPSASGKKNSVRFDLDNHQTSSPPQPPLRREEKTTTERRSSSVETFSRKTSTSTTSATTSSKPPTMPKKSSNPNTTSKSSWRPASTERPASAMAMSPRTERTLQEIDRDINQIWRELQELEKLPNGTYRPRGGSNSNSNVGGGGGGGMASKSNLPPPAQAAAAASPVTPVRVKATYIASAATPTKYSTHDPPPMAASTPSSQRRTIWDMESEMPSAAAAPAAAGTTAAASTTGAPACSKSNPVTPQVAKKIELPPRAAPPVPATALATSAPAAHSVSSAKTAQDRPPTPNSIGGGAGRISRPPQPPLPPLPPHLRPQHIKMAPIAKDESFYDLGSTKSPASEAGGLTTPSSAYDNNEYSPASGKFKGFPYIDGAPRKRSDSLKQNNNFSLLVDKSTQTATTGTDNIDKMSASTGTPVHNDVNATPTAAEMNADNCKQRKSKDTCAIL